MPTVQVEGLGNVQFPDGTAEDVMTKAIQDALAEKNAPAPLSGPIAGGSNVPKPEALQNNPESNNRASLRSGILGALKSLPQTVADVGGLVNKIPGVGDKIAPLGEVNKYEQMAHADNSDEQAGKIAGAGLQSLIPLDRAADLIPSATRAGKALDTVETAAKNVRVPLNSTVAPLGRVTEIGERGGVLPSSANALLKRSQMIGDMSFPEARDYYKNITQLSGDEANKLSPVMKKAVGALREGFHGDLKSAADTVGMGDTYANAMKEYAKASALKEGLKTAATKVLPAGLAGGGVLGAIDYGIKKLRGE